MMNKKTSIDADIDIGAVMAELAELKKQVKEQEEEQEGKPKRKSMKEQVDARCLVDWDAEKIRRTWMYLKPADPRVFFKWLTSLDPEFNFYELVPGDEFKKWVDFNAPNSNPITIYKIDAENKVRYNEMMLGWMPLDQRKALDRDDLESQYGKAKEIKDNLAQVNEDTEKHYVDTHQYNMRTKEGTMARAYIDEPKERNAKEVTKEMMMT